MKHLCHHIDKTFHLQIKKSNKSGLASTHNSNLHRFVLPSILEMVNVVRFCRNLIIVYGPEMRKSL